MRSLRCPIFSQVDAIALFRLDTLAQAVQLEHEPVIEGGAPVSVIKTCSSNRTPPPPRTPSTQMSGSIAKTIPG
jgi:hypothetical protein